jgi:hypothetical protein
MVARAALADRDISASAPAQGVVVEVQVLQALCLPLAAASTHAKAHVQVC